MDIDEFNKLMKDLNLKSATEKKNETSLTYWERRRKAYLKGCPKNTPSKNKD